MAFTKEQELAISSDGRNIIVSAGAGSGKTAVLSARVMRKLSDGIDIDKLLILTFTNEAANEMKTRIRNLIIKNKLTKQLDLIDLAYITTFDSFALSLVKKYHYLLNVTKDIKIINSETIKIYKYKLLDTIFEDMYDDNDFQVLINDFCLKDDKSIKDFIIMLDEKLDLLIEKDNYLDNYLDNYYNEEYLDNLIHQYENLIKEKINELKDIYTDFLSYINDNLASKLDTWFKLLFNGNKYSDYLLFKNYPSVRFVGVDEAGIETRDILKNKIKEINELLRFDSVKNIKSSLLDTQKYLKVIIKIIKKLDKEVLEYKDQYQIYEFNDIAHMAIKIVKNNPLVAEEIKASFNEIMIDEYQDTSIIQETFINCIANNNVYMVGDVKQSIYRFRNANPYIFAKKYDRYSNNLDGMKIDLTKNFRSRNETITNINEIFNLIMDEEIGNANYQLSHNMIFGNDKYNLEDTKVNNSLEIYNYDLDSNPEFTKEEKELFIVSEDINKKIRNKYQVFDKESNKLRNITYGDICIITDRNKYLGLYKKILEYQGIPSVIYMDEELNSDLIVLVIKNLISLVYHVNNKMFDDKFRYLFTSVARSFLFSYSDDVIYKILNERNYFMTDIVKKASNINLLRPISVVINDIICEYQVYDKLLQLNDIEKNIIIIDNLIGMANNLDDLDYSLLDFVDYLDDTINMGLSVKYSVNTGVNNAVKIMNIHKSKGLEFSLCYFVGMHNKFTIKDTTNKNLYSEKYGIIMPYLFDNELENTILKDIYVYDYFKEEISEKIRLFYVALTRCREKMIIVTSLNKENDKYNNLVPSNVRIKYRSFLDILNSLKVIDKYIVNKEANYTHDYDKVKLKDIIKVNNNDKITKKMINLTYSEIGKEKYSKIQFHILSKDEISKMEYGAKIHEIMEYNCYKDNDNEYVTKLLAQVDKNYLNIYHEYEFIDTCEENESYGIIDLMIEYDKEILIIDYKLKNISDSEYQKQLKGYEKYLSKISDKQIKTYLYSINDNILREVI